MPNLRGKTWTTTTPANVADAQFWEDHLTPDAGTEGQVLTVVNSSGDVDWQDPASSGHTIVDEDDTEMPYRTNLQFLNAEVTDDSVTDSTVVDCKGSKGDPGDAATVTVGTVTTLPAGSSATVTNSGTTSAAVFDFGIPKGADGTGAVSSVNGQTGDVVLTASDVGALPSSTVIPTVYDATLTIQQNGTTVDTFTANSDTDTTVNIVTDSWAATASVSSGSVTFSGVDDSNNDGYEVYFEVTTVANYYAKMTALSGAGTASMSVTYATNAPNGTNNAKLRRIK